MRRTFTLFNNDEIICTEKSAIFKFSKSRVVLSTGALNGGIRHDLTHVFNYSDCHIAGVCQPMKGANVEEHQSIIAHEIGLDPRFTTGLDTAVNLDNMVFVTKEFEDIKITAGISAGADVNGLCAGDPTTLTERKGKACTVTPGTINIFLITNKSLTAAALINLVTTATEAKSAVLRDLMQGSTVSCELATGTGTDGIIIVCDDDSENTIHNTGKHFKFGEIAAQAVREALQEALFRQTGFCAETQHTALARLKRFNVTNEKLSKYCKRQNTCDYEQIEAAIYRVSKDSFLVGAVSLYVHLVDQYRAGMITKAEALDWCNHLLDELVQHYRCPWSNDDNLIFIDALIDFIAVLIGTHINEKNRLYGTEA